MNQTKHKLLLILGALFLSLSCNKGDFDPTKCDDCRELMTCYDGVCDCDTTIAFKIWQKCYTPEPNRYVNYGGDSTIRITGMIMDSVSYDPNSGWYKYDLYFDESEKGYFQQDLTIFPEDFSTRLVPQASFDSLYMNAHSYFYYRDGIGYQWKVLGKRFGTDSMQIRIFLLDKLNGNTVDSSSVISLHRL